MIYVHWLFLVVYSIIIIITMVRVLMDNRQPAKTMAWMLVLMFIPFLGIILYIFGMLTSYIASTVYHAAREDSQMKHILRKWDHAAIYWHIAGSYSPFTLIALRQIGFWGWGLFIFVWFCALIGTIMSFHKLKAHSNLETICFIGMGLSILMAFNPLIHSLPASSFGWLIAEGISDITGALFYTLHKRRYMHSIFHFFILGGSICHIIAVWNMLNYLF